jgi:hypothetical protein
MVCRYFKISIVILNNNPIVSITTKCYYFFSL